MYVCDIKDGILEIRKVQPQLTLYAFNALQYLNICVTGGKHQLILMYEHAHLCISVLQIQIQFTWASK